MQRLPPRPLPLALALSLLASAAPRARAAEGLPAPSLYLGVHGGWNAVLGDWDVDPSATGDARPESSPLFGLRVGFQITGWLGVEVGTSVIPFDTDRQGTSGLALHWTGDLVLTPIEAAWSPHVALGAGAYQLASGDLGDDADWDVHAGLGLRGVLLPWLVLRAEARYNLTDSFSSGLAGLFDVTVGVDLYTNPEPAPDLDTDADGLDDDDDLCPSEAGVESADGCPDGDGDGTRDADDACPTSPGPAKQRGCGDADRDGVLDDADRCPAVPGAAVDAGCPPPPPDRDADGTPDADDVCPLDRGQPQTGGCPDHDADLVADTNDRCPTEVGVPEEQGCLPKAVTRFVGIVKGVDFQAGGAILQRASVKVLDELARLLARYPSLRLEVSAHTDARGAADANLALSEERARAVRDHLVASGVAADRIVALGHGASRPVGTRAVRRVEIRLLGAY
ncbi:MAG: OmpA family protein [Deltaproteobacteria bacterium]|nr:OmpA family protein [Deltaproteobacteria bacterium]